MPSSFFSPYEEHLDPTLFGEGYQIRGTVRVGLLSMMYATLDKYFVGGKSWSRAWIAGSGVSYQWGSNNDLDVLVGVKYEDFRYLNPTYRQMSDLEISKHINEIFRSDLQPHTEDWHGYEVTFYVFSGRRTKVCTCEDSPQKSARGSSGLTDKGSRVASSATPSTSTSSNSSTSESGWANLGGSGSLTAGQEDLGQQLAPLVGSAPTSGAGSASLASSGISGSGTTTGSTESGSKTTSDYWSNKAGSAPSVVPPTQTGTAPISALTTATTQGESGVSSASPATQSLVGSGIPPSRSTSSCSTCEEEVFLQPFDIRTILPYAAYSLTDDSWTVEPTRNAPSVPAEWEHEASGMQKRAQLAIRRYSEAHTSMVNAPHDVARVSAESAMKHSLAQAADLFHQVHEGRKYAFGPGGSGYSDRHNFLWQAGKRDGWLPALKEMKNYYDTMTAQQHLSTYGVELPDTDVLIRRAAAAYAARSPENAASSYIEQATQQNLM
jgi:hypothetical protein